VQNLVFRAVEYNLEIMARKSTCDIRRFRIRFGEIEWSSSQFHLQLLLITMNTVRSVWLGWGTLMVAGGTAFYFAKRDINVHRREQELKGIRGTEYLECIAP
jgi:hypothetical protein